MHSMHASIMPASSIAVVRDNPLTLSVEDADHLLTETALGLSGGALHVQHEGIALHLERCR